MTKQAKKAVAAKQSTSPAKGTQVLEQPGDLSDLVQQFTTAAKAEYDASWELARIVSEAHTVCQNAEEAAAQGYDQPTPQKRYGAWVEEAVRSCGITYSMPTLQKYRDVWTVFGGQRDRVAHISWGILQELAPKSLEDFRKPLITELVKVSKRPAGLKQKDAREIIKAHREDHEAKQGGGKAPAKPAAKDDGESQLEGIYYRARELKLYDDQAASNETAYKVACSQTSASLSATAFDNMINAAIDDLNDRIGSDLPRLQAMRRAIELSLLAQGEAEATAAAERDAAEAAKVEKAAKQRAKRTTKKAA